MEEGRDEVATRWIAIPESTCLMRMMRPAKDKNLAFQDCNLLLTLSKGGRKCIFFGVPNTIGMPKKVSYAEVSWILRIELIFLFLL